jgi:hypothetical protein
MKEIRIRLTDKEYHQYVKKGQSEYRMRMKKDMEYEEYVKWMSMLGESDSSDIRVKRVAQVA